MKPRLLASAACVAPLAALGAMALYQYGRRGMTWGALAARESDSGAAALLAFAELRESALAVAIGALAGLAAAIVSRRRGGGALAVVAIAFDALAFTAAMLALMAL